MAVGKTAFVEKVAVDTGVSPAILERVYDRGLAAWRTGHRPGTTPHQWARARVYSFVQGGKTTKRADRDLAVEAGIVSNPRTPGGKLVPSRYVKGISKRAKAEMLEEIDKFAEVDPSTKKAYKTWRGDVDERGRRWRTQRSPYTAAYRDRHGARRNPDHHILTALELEWIKDKVPESWLPVGAHHLGHGLFGEVWATGDPKVVVKLTADEEEVAFAKYLISLGAAAPCEGLVRYFAALDTDLTREVPWFDPKDRERARLDPYASPPEPKGYSRHRMSLLWRESAIHVGLDDMKTRPPEPVPPDPMPRLTGLSRIVWEKKWRDEQEGWGDAAETFEQFMARQDEWHAGRKKRYEEQLEKWRGTRWFTLDEIDAAQDLWIRGIWPYYLAAKALRGAQKREDVEGVEKHLGELDAAVKRLASSGLRWSGPIADTLGKLLARGIVLRDLNQSNFGFVVREDGERLVITDPSQALFLDKSL